MLSTNNLMFLLFIFLLTNTYSCLAGDLHEVQHNFVNNSDEKNWYALVAAVVKDENPLKQCWVWPVRYHYYRVRYNFPNSHALLSDSDRDAVHEKNESEMNSSMLHIDICSGDIYMKQILFAMENQNFDEELSKSARTALKLKDNIRNQITK